MNKDVHWYGFHTDHDFAYMHKMFTGDMLPIQEHQFMINIDSIFPNVYDIKLIAELHLNYFQGSLAYLTSILGLSRDDNC